MRVLRERDAILLPQRLRLIGAAKRVGSDARTFLGPGVVPSKKLSWAASAVSPSASASVEWPSIRSLPNMEALLTRRASKRTYRVCSGQKMMGVSPDQRNRQVHQEQNPSDFGREYDPDQQGP